MSIGGNVFIFVQFPFYFREKAGLKMVGLYSGFGVVKFEDGRFV